MNRTMSYVMVALAAFLLLFSVAQAIQVSNLRSGMEYGTPAASQQEAAPEPAVYAQAPVMVGGC